MGVRHTPESFWARSEPADNGCRLWKGAVQSDGYGSLSYQRRAYVAHRLAWELTNGPIPEGVCVCHTCDTPRCVNPEHLFLGDHSANMADMARKGRRRNVNTGAGNGRAVLTEAEALLILSLYRAREATQVELAARFGVNQTTISRLVRGSGWRELQSAA